VSGPFHTIAISTSINEGVILSETPEIGDLVDVVYVVMTVTPWMAGAVLSQTDGRARFSFAASRSV